MIQKQIQKQMWMQIFVIINAKEIISNFPVFPQKKVKFTDNINTQDIYTVGFVKKLQVKSMLSV